MCHFSHTPPPALPPPELPWEPRSHSQAFSAGGLLRLPSTAFYRGLSLPTPFLSVFLSSLPEIKRGTSKVTCNPTGRDLGRDTGVYFATCREVQSPEGQAPTHLKAFSSWAYLRVGPGWGGGGPRCHGCLHMFSNHLVGGDSSTVCLEVLTLWYLDSPAEFKRGEVRKAILIPGELGG